MQILLKLPILLNSDHNSKCVQAMLQIGIQQPLAIGKIVIDKMGQQIALEQKPIINQHVSGQGQQNSQNITIQNKQGFLKVSQYPFPNSTKITRQDTASLLYVQKCKRIQEQILTRRALGKYFTKAQILDMIESTVFTLVSLQQQNIAYKDISSQHIFVVEERGRNRPFSIKCKFLPNQLIEENTFQRLKRINKRVVQQQKCFTFSPEMIIALRARQKHFNDQSLLKKSNVFSLGIVLLQIATLQLSSNFYNGATFDIYQEVIEGCLEDVQKRYGSLVTGVLANMMDFDFEERIDSFSELAKWILLELKDNRLDDDSNQHIADCCEQMQAKLVSNSVSQNQPNQQNMQTLPVCLQKVNKTKAQGKLQQREQQLILKKYNNQNQKKINIKVREVSVYIQKNSNFQSDRENNSRLLYSPFLNPLRQSSLADSEFRKSSKTDLVGQFSRRGLAFDSTYNKTKPRLLLRQNILPSNPIKTQR